MNSSQKKDLLTTEDNNINFLFVLKILKDWKKISIIFIASFLYAFGTIIFLIQANTIPSGVSSISQTLAYFFIELKPFVTLIYFGLNIPLILFFWNKIKKSFIILSLLFMFFNAFWGFILGEFGNSINDWFVVIKDWDIDKINTPGYSTWPIFIYVSLGLFINSVAASMAWRCGASTGGTDIIAFYFSTKKKQDVGNFLWIISILLSFFSIIALYAGGKYESFFGVRTICSIFYILLNSVFINLLYPKYKKILVKIDSKKYEEIIRFFKEINYWHGFKILESVSGYTGEKNYTIETVILLAEYKDIKKQLIELDPNIWITKSFISDVSGNFDYSKLD